MEVLLNFLSENFWATAMLLAAVTTPITSAIDKKFNLSKAWKQVVAWVISALLVVGSYFLNLVEFNEPVYVTVPLTGLLVGLSSNGIYDIRNIKNAVMNWFKNFSTMKTQINNENK